MKVSQILLEEYDPPPGATGTKLTLTMQVEYSASYASASDLTELATLALNASLPSGFSPVSEAVTVKPATKPVVHEDGSARWTKNVEREIIKVIDSAQVTHLIQGYRASLAQSRLEENLPLASSPKVSLSPSWWPWVPIVPFRISVVTQ